MARARVYRSSAAGGVPTNKVRVYRSSADGGAPVGPHVRVYRSAADGPAAMTLRPIANVTDAEPLSTVTLTAVPAAGSATPTTYVWRRVSGASVTIVGAGPVVQVIAPPSMDGTAVVVGVRGVIGSAQSPEQTVTITALPQIRWYATDAGWTPIPAPLVLSGPVTPVPIDVYQDVYRDIYGGSS